MVVYLCNVGTRDVTYRGEKLEPPREAGARLLARYAEVQDALDAPILRPGLQFVLERAGRIDRLILFASDQSETTNHRFRSNDTVFLAQLLQRRLPELFPGQTDSVQVYRIPHNPADYNRCMEFFARVLQDLFPTPEAVATAYVAPVGGADASNVSLWFNALRWLGVSCEIIYVMPDGTVHPIALGQVFLQQERARQAEALLQRYDFRGLADLLAAADLGRPFHHALARYWDCRLAFDFDGAVGELQRIYPQVQDEERALVTRLMNELAPLRAATDTDQHTRQRWLLAELFLNLEVKAKLGEWVDFLGRLFRLREALLRMAFESETNVPTHKEKEAEFTAFSAYMQQQTGLSSYLQKKHIRVNEPNELVLHLVISYWVKHEHRQALRPLQVLSTELERLSELRNKCIIAHSYEGVSKERIERESQMAVTELLEKLRAYLSAQSLPVADVFEQLEYACRLLREAVRTDSEL